MQSLNGAQFLNITPLFLTSDFFTASSAPTRKVFIVPLTAMDALL